MSDNRVKCFLCIEKANNHRILICKSCICSLLVQHADTCLRSTFKEESCSDAGEWTTFEPHTEEIDGEKNVEDLNGTCDRHYEDDKNIVDIDGVGKNGHRNGDSKELELLDDKYEEIEGVKSHIVKHQDHELFHPKDLMIYNMLGHNITKLIEEFYHVETNFNKKITELGVAIERNNREIDEIKEMIEATTLQLKTLINEHERALLSCLDRHAIHPIKKQKTDLQSALEEVNQSIEITREMLKDHDENKLHGSLKEDDDSGICDDDDDTSSKRASMMLMIHDVINSPKAVIPDSIHHVMTFGSSEELNDPVGVTTSTDGSNIFVSDYSNDRIQVFHSTTGQLIRTLEHVTSDTGRQTSFLCPTGLATNAKTGDIILAERGRHRITVMIHNYVTHMAYSSIGVVELS